MFVLGFFSIMIDDIMVKPRPPDLLFPMMLWEQEVGGANPWFNL